MFSIIRFIANVHQEKKKNQLVSQKKQVEDQIGPTGPSGLPLAQKILMIIWVQSVQQILLLSLQSLNSRLPTRRQTVCLFTDAQQMPRTAPGTQEALRIYLLHKKLSNIHKIFILHINIWTKQKVTLRVKILGAQREKDQGTLFHFLLAFYLFVPQSLLLVTDLLK